MRFAEEIVARDVVPTLRSLLAKRLAAGGMTQQGIARVLGVSQTAVSNYLAGAEENPVIAGDRRVKDTVDRVAAGVEAKTLDTYGALALFTDLIRRLESRGPVCALHEEAVPDLKGLECDLCVRDPRDAGDEAATLRALSRALRSLQGDRTLARLIPDVGSNLALAKPGARSHLDVAAVPGRITVVRDELRVPASPEFGASRHVAEVLAAVHARFPEVRAAMNVAFDAAVGEALGKARAKALEVGPAAERKPAELAQALADAAQAPDALYHRGGFGIEPQTYLLGPDPPAVVALARRIAGAVDVEPGVSYE